MKKPKEPMPINVRFSPRVRADGVLIRVVIEQDGQEVQLTVEQAQSLVKTLNSRLPKREALSGAEGATTFPGPGDALRNA